MQPWTTLSRASVLSVVEYARRRTMSIMKSTGIMQALYPPNVPVWATILVAWDRRFFTLVIVDAGSQTVRLVHFTTQASSHHHHTRHFTEVNSQLA